MDDFDELVKDVTQKLEAEPAAILRLTMAELHRIRLALERIADAQEEKNA